MGDVTVDADDLPEAAFLLSVKDPRLVPGVTLVAALVVARGVGQLAQDLFREETAFVGQSGETEGALLVIFHQRPVAGTAEHVIIWTLEDWGVVDGLGTFPTDQVGA